MWSPIPILPLPAGVLGLETYSGEAYEEPSPTQHIPLLVVGRAGGLLGVVWGVSLRARQGDREMGDGEYVRSNYMTFQVGVYTLVYVDPRMSMMLNVVAD